MLLLIQSESWLGLAAIIASFGGVFVSVFSIRYGRQDATKVAEMNCHDRLLRVQRHAEQLSQELYELRMTRYGGFEVTREDISDEIAEAV